MKSKSKSPSKVSASPDSASATKETVKRIFLVDDHPMMRDGMARLLESEPGFTCCGGAHTAEEAISEVARLKPDLVITDITLPNRSGLELIKDIHVQFPAVLVFVYSMHDEMLYAERSLRAGARGYLMKEAGSEKMLEAIRHVLTGEVYVSPRMSAKILSNLSGLPKRGTESALDKLSDREFEIYQLIGQGKATKEIAKQLRISEKTVAVHREHLKEKLGVHSASELAHHAIRWFESMANSR